VPFDSPDRNLGILLAEIEQGRIQLPDFQREWRREAASSGLVHTR